MEKLTYDSLLASGNILFEVVVGSRAYGTHREDSDWDRKFVYILPPDYILGLGYVEGLSVNKDWVGWEIRRFLELLGSANPTVLEVLYSPEDCIISRHPIFDVILEARSSFVTKGCLASFGGWAVQNIKKARKGDGKINFKDMMHCIRLVRMAREIGLGEGLRVRREDREELLRIRNGEVALEELIRMGEAGLVGLDQIFEESNLPQRVDRQMIHELLIRVRKGFYGGME